jgi:hypothetical protein
MKLRLGRTFHSSATGRRRDDTLPEVVIVRQADDDAWHPLPLNPALRFWPFRFYSKRMPLAIIAIDQPEKLGQPT